MPFYDINNVFGNQAFYSDPKVLESGDLHNFGSETQPNTLYQSDLYLLQGYLYGVQIRAVNPGVINFQVSGSLPVLVSYKLPG